MYKKVKAFLCRCAEDLRFTKHTVTQISYLVSTRTTNMLQVENVHGAGYILFTSVFIHHSLTYFTFDLAAPDKLAMASFHMSDYFSVVATTTTQKVTAVRSI